MSFIPEDGHMHDGEDDELVRRLRELEWPAVDPLLKHQCWIEFNERIVPSQRDATLESGERLDFTGRRAPMRGLVPAARLNVAGGWLRTRALAGLAASY